MKLPSIAPPSVRRRISTGLLENPQCLIRPVTRLWERVLHWRGQVEFLLLAEVWRLLRIRLRGG